MAWAEIKCTVSDLEGLQAELAELDENFVRKDLSDDEFRELLLRRKEIYESLHPETRATYDGGAFRGNQHQNVVTAKSAATTKSFVQDTAEKTGKSPRTIRQEIQTAKNMTPEAKGIIKGGKVSKTDALKLSRLSPGQQEEAATQLVAGDIKSVDQYHPVPAKPDTPAPPSPGPGYYPTTKDSVADLKNPDKDRSHTPDTFLMSFVFFLQRFCQGVVNYASPEYAAVFPALSQEQMNQIRQEINKKKHSPNGRTQNVSQQITITNMNADTQSTEELLSTSILFSGQPYQQPIKDHVVNKLVREWDSRLLTPLVVSYRDGQYNLVDGQHRVCAMRRKNGGKDVTALCRVYRGMTYEEEAELYYKLDRAKGHLRLPNATKALIESGSNADKRTDQGHAERGCPVC